MVLVGVRVWLSFCALPTIFALGLVKLLGGGGIAARGGRTHGLALVLFGVTTLQQGMGGLVESLHPSDLPAVLVARGAGWVSGAFGLRTLVVVGLVMTAVMLSSTAPITVTFSAYYAGAIGVDQGCALIIGRNIWTATSSAMAAIGASPIAKTLAVAYILFKVIAVRFALVSFPVIIRLLVRAENVIDGVTLLAAFRMAYNLVGVFVLVPVIGWFTRFLEIALGTLRLAHRSAILGKVATGELIADEAIARVDAVTRLEALERHAWRSAATAGRDK